MAVNAIDYEGTGAISSKRGPSGVIWGDCPVLELIEDPSKGMYFFDDFLQFPAGIYATNTGNIGNWTSFGATGAAQLDGQLEGGVIKIGSDGDNEGVTFQSATGWARFITTSTLALNGKMWFEARFARSSITTDVADYFVGLMAPTLSAAGIPVVAQPITTTDDTLMTAGDFFGFHSNSNTGTRGGPTEMALAFELAAGTVNYPTNMTTLMASSGNSVLTADGFVKVGFIFDPSAINALITLPTARQTAGNTRRKLLRVFVNGLEVPTFLTSDDIQNATAAQAFPTAFMAPCFAIMNTSAGTPTLEMDWIRCAQMANS